MQKQGQGISSHPTTYFGSCEASFFQKKSFYITVPRFQMIICGYVNRCHQGNFYNSITHIPDKPCLLFQNTKHLPEISAAHLQNTHTEYVGVSQNKNDRINLCSNFLIGMVKYFDLLHSQCVTQYANMTHS